MTFEEFEAQARLYVVGALDEHELDAFQEARRELGDRAERAIAEFRNLNAVFALSLQPHPPHPETKRKLLHAIRKTMHDKPEQEGCGGQPIPMDGDLQSEH